MCEKSNVSADVMQIENDLRRLLRVGESTSIDADAKTAQIHFKTSPRNLAKNDTFPRTDNNSSASQSPTKSCSKTDDEVNVKTKGNASKGKNKKVRKEKSKMTKSAGVVDDKPEGWKQLKMAETMPVHTVTVPCVFIERRSESDEKFKHSVEVIPNLPMLIEDAKPPPEVLERLAKNYIYPLKKRYSRFPKALFYCRLCEYHCDTLNVCERHMKDNRHQRNKNNKELDITLHSLPPPYQFHSEVVDELVTQIGELYGISQEEVEQRQKFVEEINEFATKDINGCHLRVYGSSLSGVALKTSDLNIDLVIDSKTNPAEILIAVYETLKNHTGLENVRSDFTAKIPSIYFFHAELKLNCVINLNNFAACKTASLIGEYVKLDPRVKILAVAFRYWAQLCMIDDQDMGTLPSYTFALMCIYFLQQCQPPVLPVLHEMSKEKGEDIKIDQLIGKWHSTNTESVGQLWIMLFRFYSISFKLNDFVISIQQKRPLPRAEKMWSSKRIAIEDPYATKRNVARSISNQLIADFVIDRFKATYKYFGIPQTKNGPLFSKLLLVDLEDKSDKKTTSSRLFLDVLENISQKNESTDDAKSRKDSSSKKHDDTDMVITISAKGSEKSNSDHSRKQENDPSESEDSDTEKEPSLMDEIENVIKKASELKISEVIDENVEDEDEEGESDDDDDDGDKLTDHTKKTGKSEKETEGVLVNGLVAPNMFNTPLNKRNLPLELEEKLVAVTKEDLQFKFEKLIFTSGKTPSKFCSLCQREGHLKNNCPDEKLPPLRPLPPMDPEFMKDVECICLRIYKDHLPSLKEIEDRKKILQDLQDFIRKTYPDAMLELFGSSCNGFGFAKSDLDICLTFTDKNSDDLNFIVIIEDLAEKLKRHKGLYNVIAITTAKVPIVKFTHRGSQLEGDISLYNTLAQHNTRMLNMYSELDTRVKILGYIMKVFAKLCNIGDASRGSLSSYAYILMVIYYLQQRNPPVIPVLQELYTEDVMPKNDVDGWNAWFFEDREKLRELWPHLGKNFESVAELWLGLLRYYTETFRFDELVVSIRQKKPLTRFEKLWNSKCIAIEDPFDLQHNLGAGVSRKMNNYILKAFIQGRNIFGTPLPIDGYRNDTVYLQRYLFNSSNLTDGAPPNDRGCRICGKIGHVMKECPRRRGNQKSREKGGQENNSLENNRIQRNNKRMPYSRNQQQQQQRQQLQLSPPHQQQQQQQRQHHHAQLHHQQHHHQRQQQHQIQSHHHQQQQLMGMGRGSLMDSLGSPNKMHPRHAAELEANLRKQNHQQQFSMSQQQHLMLTQQQHLNFLKNANPNLPPKLNEEVLKEKERSKIVDLDKNKMADGNLIARPFATNLSNLPNFPMQSIGGSGIALGGAVKTSVPPPGFQHLNFNYRMPHHHQQHQQHPHHPSHLHSHRESGDMNLSSTVGPVRSASQIGLPAFPNVFMGPQKNFSPNPPLNENVNLSSSSNNNNRLVTPATAPPSSQPQYPAFSSFTQFKMAPQMNPQYNVAYHSSASNVLAPNSSNFGSVVSTNQRQQQMFLQQQQQQQLQHDEGAQKICFLGKTLTSVADRPTSSTSTTTTSIPKTKTKSNRGNFIPREDCVAD